MNNNIPVPKHIIINNINKSDFLNNYDLKFPAVLKPIDGMQGTDVHTFIKTRSQFIKILEQLLIKYDSIMMEEQVYGDNYRIFVFNNQIMDVIKREQPFIIGNGIDTVEKLIINKNNDQIKKKLFPTKKIDYDYILEQGYNKDDIIKQKEKIFITNTINFHNGANPVRINLDEISNENKDIFIKAHKLINLECSGIDYMSSDIKVPYYENDGHIIEINDMVDTKIHIDADNGANPNFLFKKIVESLDSN
jgi:cyanophycin synthetase